MGWLALMRCHALVLIALAGFVLDGAKARPQETKSASIGIVEAQDSCNQQAFALYKSEGYASEPTGSYTVHYSVKRKQCFAIFRKIDQVAIPGSDLELRVFLDAVTKKVYGTYTFSSESQRTIECNVLDDSGKRRECNALAGFEELLSPYFN